MNDAFVGMDVAFARYKRLPIVVCIWQGTVLRPLPLREITAVLPPLGGGNVDVLDTANVVSFVHDVVRYLGAIERLVVSRSDA
jgi:hypothetical protein